MNLYLLLILVPPILVVLVMRGIFGSTISGREMLAQTAVPLILVIGVWSLARYSMLADTEILNGKVVSKEQVWVPCSHSYECNCTTDSKGNRSCQTCYEHNNDWDWTVYTTVGSFDVERVDRRGSDEPPRWTVVQKDQPVAKEHYYINYIQAAPDSLFHFIAGKNYKGPLPTYPRVYDYQYADRALTVGGNVPNIHTWNDRIARALNDLGHLKQVNVVVVFTNARPNFADALRTHWLGGKKNDLTVVIGTDYPTIRWVRIFSWSKYDIINVALRNDLLESQTLDPDKTVGIISKDISQYYERKPMADFRYLADEAVPPMWVLIFALLLGTGSSIGLGLFFKDNVCFE